MPARPKPVPPSLTDPPIRFFGCQIYLNGMPKALYEPCLPTRGKEVPAGADWIHEIKYDGYRLIVRREGKTVRLFTKNGNDWSKRYPWIMETALKIKQDRFVIDGEAVVLGVNGVSDFDASHSRQHDDEVQLYAFDMLATDGDDIRKLPLSARKSKLDGLLARRPDGIFVAPFEPGPLDARMFPKACEMGLEGMVSKRLDSPYRPGPQRSWVKVKNPLHPAMYRVKDALS
jgi:bifunctional non-homologous end joining protein LigD